MNMNYVALPEQLYNEVRRYIGSQPYDVVKDFVAAIEKEARYVEQILPEQPATETATGEEISSTGN